MYSVKCILQILVDVIPVLSVSGLDYFPASLKELFPRMGIKYYLAKKSGPMQIGRAHV